MRVVIAMMKHETNTFSPLVTDLARFEARGSYFGNEAIARYGGTKTPFGAFVGLAREIGDVLRSLLTLESGNDFLNFMLLAILSSTYFLYRAEPGGPPVGVEPGAVSVQ